MEQVRNLRRLDSTPGNVVPGELLRWNSLDGSVTVEDLSKAKESPSTLQGAAQEETEEIDENPSPDSEGADKIFRASEGLGEA
jgi:hypothetical protein